MVYGFALKYSQVSELQLLQAIMRNFSGLSDLNPVLLFSKHLPTLKHCSNVGLNSAACRL